VQYRFLSFLRASNSNSGKEILVIIKVAAEPTDNFNIIPNF
jgi:hypothetical protein